jgi:hypothetical protein
MTLRPLRTISGQVQPVNLVATVIADASNKDFTAGLPALAYCIDGLAAGTYTLSFTPATGYSAPCNAVAHRHGRQTVTAVAVTLSRRR